MVASVGTNFLTAVIGLLQCSRRKETASASPQKRDVCQGARKKQSSAKHTDSDDAQKSTDISSSDPITADPSTDGSDLDTPCQNAKQSLMAVQPPPGLTIRPPPGLEAPPGLEDVTPCPPREFLREKGSRLNTNAKAFFPSGSVHLKADDRKASSQRLRETIHLLKESLQGLGSEQPGMPVQAQAEAAEQDALSTLKEAISKLTPQDAGVLRSFLHAKETGMTMKPPSFRDTGPVTPLGGPPWASQTVGTRPMQRQFKPFLSAKKPAPPKPPVQMGDDADTLRTSLRDLAQLDSNRVVLVRRINRLGLDSPAALQDYFAKYGTIDRLLVSHSRSKSTSGTTRVRPATVGFLVMSNADDAQAILAQPEHIVQGAAIVVSTFQSHAIGE